MKRTNKRRSESGAAMVELAVLMVAFVPMILIPLYLQDALLYKLTLQERVFSSAWDFAMGDYEKKEISAHWGSIDTENQKIFKNCKSGNDKDKSDPASPWADFRWPSSGVNCTQKDRDFMKPTGLIPLAADFHDEYTKGGLVECKGSIEVANHYVPQKVEMLTLKKNKDFFQKQDEFIEHNDGGQPLTFGLVVDPWTIHEPDNIEDRDGNDPFVERVDYCWNGATTSLITFEVFEIAWIAFMAKAVSKKILSPALAAFEYPPRPDDISVVHPIKEEYDRDTAWGRDRFWISPYCTNSSDCGKFKDTYDNRKQTYLGCDSALDNGNCGS